MNKVIYILVLTILTMVDITTITTIIITIITIITPGGTQNINCSLGLLDQAVVIFDSISPLQPTEDPSLPTRIERGDGQVIGYIREDTKVSIAQMEEVFNNICNTSNITGTTTTTTSRTELARMEEARPNKEVQVVVIGDGNTTEKILFYIGVSLSVAITLLTLFCRFWTFYQESNNIY